MKKQKKYVQVFREVCKGCQGNGLIETYWGEEIVDEICPACDGVGLVPQDFSEKHFFRRNKYNGPRN